MAQNLFGNKFFNSCDVAQNQFRVRFLAMIETISVRIMCDVYDAYAIMPPFYTQEEGLIVYVTHVELVPDHSRAASLKMFPIPIISHVNRVPRTAATFC